jgi:pyruvate/2-oxoglutarate dehydrogenase complex dihydrolipoamide dehydrogenase (E3) component
VLANGAPVPHLWAVGDVTGKMMLAHTAAAQGTVAIDNILGHARRIDYRSIPAATFTHPEISSVGLRKPMPRSWPQGGLRTGQLCAATSRPTPRPWPSWRATA